MIKNYLKAALRFLKQNKIFTAINTLGLSIALAASFIILLYIINELSYNHLHKNRKQVYRVLNDYKDFNITQYGTPYILATALKDEFPQVEVAVRERYLRGLKLKLNDEYINITYPVATDSEIFEIFTIPLIENSGQKNLLDDLSSIILSEELAEKFFPGQNPVGKEIMGFVNNGEHLFVVQGVYEDMPQNSTFRAECLVNSKWTLAPINETFGVNNADQLWYMDFWHTWIRLSESGDPESLEKQFGAFEVEHISEDPHNHYRLQGLTDVYLDSDDVMNTGIHGNLKNIRLFAVVALLIIIVAAINYIILSTAISSGRIKEIGIRKTFGAAIDNIKAQLLSESLILAILVLPFSLIMFRLALPWTSKLFHTHLNIISSNVLLYISVYLVLTILIGVLSGIYTSVYLSKLNVIDILKNVIHTGKNKIYIRSVLIVFQLIIFCSFVSGTLFIRSQYLFALNRDPGFYTRDVIMIDLGRDFKEYSAFINNIKSIPSIIEASGTMMTLPTMSSMSSMIPHFQDKSVSVNVEGFSVDYNFIKTLGIKVLEGREFSPEFGSDLTQSVMLNEAAVKQLGIIDPLGQQYGGRTIIGIVKDFDLHSIRSEVPPLEIRITDRFIQQVAIHYRPGTLENILPMLEAEWKKVASDRPFLYTTIEDIVKQLYSSEKNLVTIVSIFSLFVLLVAATGLFGLTLFIARSRTKEIGIKKVYGSSEISILSGFILNNLILILVSVLISIPVTLYFVIRWLDNFAFKTNINWWVFVIAFIIAALVVLPTVFIYSFKVSRVNPVEALRNE